MSTLLAAAIDQIKGERILVCPLNWGLGHATRCVPIVDALLARGKTVILAADGYPLEFLRNEFPCLQCVEFKGIAVRYSNESSQARAMLQQLPAFAKSMWREHREIAHLIDKFAIDTIISDNRFCLWNKRCQSIYITHQLMVKMPMKWRFFEKPIWRLHRFFINRYNSCWIPDDPELKLAGDLSHKYKLPKNAQFIGILSRFSGAETNDISASPYETIVLISGPEPHRSILEKKMVGMLQGQLFRSLIVRGVPNDRAEETNILNIKLVPHIDTASLQQLLRATPTIFCRSGYSTLMDLHTIGRTATLVPTPGQTEQEYLAERMATQGFNIVAQDDL